MRVGIENSAHAAGFKQQGKQGDVEACRDGYAPQAWGGTAVDLAGRYIVVKQTVLEGKTPHDRGQQS